jgi:catalase
MGKQVTPLKQVTPFGKVSPVLLKRCHLLNNIIYFLHEKIKSERMFYVAV